MATLFTSYDYLVHFQWLPSHVLRLPCPLPPTTLSTSYENPIHLLHIPSPLHMVTPFTSCGTQSTSCIYPTLLLLLNPTASSSNSLSTSRGSKHDDFSIRKPNVFCSCLPVGHTSWSKRIPAKESRGEPSIVCVKYIFMRRLWSFLI